MNEPSLQKAAQMALLTAWTGTGAHTEAAGLPVGDHVVQVTATVDGETLDASAGFSVLPTELNYNGTLTATATLSTESKSAGIRVPLCGERHSAASASGLWRWTWSSDHGTPRMPVQGAAERPPVTTCKAQS
jgi:hypothetical protein